MRAPRIRAKICTQSPSIVKAEKPQNAGCVICRKICLDDKRTHLMQSDRLTRSASKWIQDNKTTSIIIYETYRCMPLLGDEKIHAPDWEEHIVRYHIVFVNKNS